VYDRDDDWRRRLFFEWSGLLEERAEIVAEWAENDEREQVALVRWILRIL